MSDDRKPITGIEITTLILSGLSGIGGAIGAVFAALQYAPTYTTQILIGCLVIVALVTGGLYVALGSGSLTAKGSAGLALTFTITLAATLTVNSSPQQPKPPPPPHAIEIHAADSATHDPIDPNTVRNFKIVVINTNDTRQKITPDEDVTQIDLAHVKIVSITACNVTTEYNVEALKTTERQLSLPITFFIGLRPGGTCTDRAR